MRGLDVVDFGGVNSSARDGHSDDDIQRRPALRKLRRVPVYLALLKEAGAPKFGFLKLFPIPTDTC